jgi:hypothetical protein
VRTRRCYPITKLTRTGQFLAAASLTAGLAFAAAPIAHAEWDIGAYDECMAKTIRIPADCCLDSGGAFGSDGVTCVAPHALQQQFQPPPPPRQVIVTPVAPGSNAPILPVSPGGQAPTQTPMG